MSRLGRGLDSLLGENPPTSLDNNETKQLAIESLFPRQVSAAPKLSAKRTAHIGRFRAPTRCYSTHCGAGAKRQYLGNRGGRAAVAGGKNCRIEKSAGDNPKTVRQRSVVFFVGGKHSAGGFESTGTSTRA